MSARLKTKIKYLRSKNIFTVLILLIIFSVLSTSKIFPENQRQSDHIIITQTPGDKFNLVDPVILWNSAAIGADSIDQLSFYNALGSIGLPAAKVNLEEFRNTELNKNMLIILPVYAASFLSNKDADRIILAVNAGARIITDGSSKLTEQLKINFSSPSPVNYVHDMILHSPILSWEDAPSVSMILNSPDKSVQIIYSDSISGGTVGIIKSSGEGKILVLSAMFDPVSGEGYSRFPNITNEIITELHCMPLFQRHGIDAYFDPGYRWDFPVRKLVSIWKKWGIKAVHAAVWDMYTTPPYNFSSLVSEAHKQGILIYAWLEWPYIGTNFWDNHPLWREKNALLKDAQLDFLSLMDLQNPDCMKKAMTDLINLLKDDWDGIDIAEFSITGGVAEALEGPGQPKYFTGFNKETRKEFKSLYGFDQIDLFNKTSKHYWEKDSAGLDKFYKYRVQVNNQLLRQIVTSLDSIRISDKRDWEFIFTVLDNSLHPEFDQLLGFDLPNTLKLAKEFHAVLQVEDPSSEWTRPPSRYDQIAKYYKGIVGDIPFAIDINFVPIHPIGQPGFPSEQPTGTELFQQYHAADNACGRVCFYAESSVFTYDWDVLQYAMGSIAYFNKDKDQYNIKTPHTVIMQNRFKANKILLDGNAWPGYDLNGIIIPKGNHVLSFGKSSENSFNQDSATLRLTGITDELISCKQMENGIEIVYQSPARCLITLNCLPGDIKLDGIHSPLKVLKEKNSFIIFAPSGYHTLQINSSLKRGN
jgi:hypothetical protein